ncbi:putative DNA repair protein [Apostichopus japonicus]|uniref:Putative DNA repair protein n=1 Tax=Stichopus japonicus TaxID=307972 RepID=A0A2G8L9Y1_STIJA|nr:putative DNA repair protein [Apostichopus japonicus]
MASKTLQRIGVSPELAMRLKRHGICTCKDFLSKNELELMKVTGLSRVKLRELIEDVSRAVIPQHNTVLNIYKQNTGLFSTSLPPLDSILHGGLSHGTITEIAGPPGCGKTQFCMMFSVLATLPRPLGTANGSVAYIDTESAFSAQRLVEIARSRFPDYFNQDDNLRDLCNRVHIYQESTCRELQERIFSQRIVSQMIISQSIVGQRIISQRIISQRIVSERIVGQRIVGQRIISQSIVGQRIVGQRIICQSIVGQRIVSERIVGQRIVSQRIVGQRIVSERIVGQRIVGQRIVGQSIVGQRIVGQRIVGQRIVGQSIVGQGSSVKGSSVKGSSVKGSSVKGSSVKGSSVKESSVKESA